MKDLNSSLKICMLAGTISALCNHAHGANFALEEIVVTAQKRAQSLQDVAVTVSAVSDTAIKNSGVASINELQTIVPNLNIINSNSPAQTSISIRGAGTGGSSPTLEPSVGIFIDGVFMPRSVFGISDLVDVEQVEVLAGPQGTLYGKNTNAGVISITTKRPSDVFEASLEQSFGSYDLTDTKLSVSGPLSDNLNYRVTTRQRKQDGLQSGEYDNQEFNQIDRQSYRAMLEWTPTDSISVRPTLYYSVEDSMTGSGESFLDPNGQYAGIVSLLNGGLTENASANDHRKSLTHGTQSRLEVQGASLQAEWDRENFSITSITNYQEWRTVSTADTDETSIDLNDSTDRVQEESIAQEIRLTSNAGGDLEWVAGGFYFKSQLQRGDANHPFLITNDAASPFASAYLAGVAGLLDCAPPTPATAAACQAAGFYSAYTPGSGFTLESHHETESIALFGQISYNLDESTKINLGLRFGHEEKEFDYETAIIASGAPSGNGFTPDQFVNALSSDAQGSDDLSESDVSGMISINHYVGEAMLYASVSTGSKSGGFNGDFSPVAIDDRAFDSEETINYEIGVKFEGLLDGRARANVSYYYTEYTDFQSAYFDSQKATFIVENAGRQTTQGIDFDAMLAVNEYLTLSTRLAYLNAMYRDYENTACSNNNTKLERNANGLCDLSNTRMPFAPSLSGSISADYIYPTDGGEFFGNMAITFKTDHSTSSTYIPQGYDESFETLNLRFGYRSDAWEVAVWGKNVTDENHSLRVRGHTAAAVVAGATTDRSYINAISDPATFGITFSYDFY